MDQTMDTMEEGDSERVITMKRKRSPSSSPQNFDERDRKKILFSEYLWTTCDDTKKDKIHQLFSNDKKILKRIAQFSNLLTLKTLRLLNSTWLEVVTTLLGQRSSNFIQINFHFNQSTQQFQYGAEWTVSKNISEDDGLSKKSLQNLTNCMLTPASKKFPCSNFAFEGGDLGLEQSKTFFKTHGHQIVSLRLSGNLGGLTVYKNCDQRTRGDYVGGGDGGTSALKILYILRHHLAPTLRYLEIGGIFEINDKNQPPAPPFPFVLPALKYLKVTSCAWTLQGGRELIHLLYEILWGAINLENWDSFSGHFPLEFLQIMEKTSKIHTLKNLTIGLTTFPEAVETLEKLAGMGPKIQNLRINLRNYYDRSKFWPRISLIIFKIFTSSQSTLESMTVESPMGFLPLTENFNFLQLTHLTRLEFEMKSLDQRPYGYFLVMPKNFDWSFTLPVLHSVKLKFHHGSHRWGRENFLFDSTNGIICSTAKNLQITQSFYGAQYPVQLWFRRLPEFFPNVENLSVDCQHDDFSEICVAIWTHFRKIELKVLKITIAAPRFAQHPLQLDSIFTGFSAVNLSKFKNLPEDVHPSSLHFLRENPSILDLSGLKELQIFLYKKSHLITPLTAIFGFNLMPQGLQVKIFERDSSLDGEVDELTL